MKFKSIFFFAFVQDDKITVQYSLLTYWKASWTFISRLAMCVDVLRACVLDQPSGRSAQSPGGGHAALSHEIAKPVQSADKFLSFHISITLSIQEIVYMPIER